MWLLEDGRGLDEVQYVQGVSVLSLKHWRRNLEDYGSVIPPQNPLQSQPRTLTAEQLDDLLKAVHETPCVYLDELQNYMAFQHDVALTKARYDTLLRDCGFSYKQLQKFAAERDVELRTHFAEW